MIRRSVLAPLTLALVAVAGALGLAGCGRAPEPAGTSLMPELAAGAFLDQGLRLDFRELYRYQQATAAGPQHLLPISLAAVEEGWGGPEDWGAWALGERTRLRFFVRFRGRRDFYIECMSAAHPAGRAQTVRVRAGGWDLGSFAVGPSWEVHRLPLPDTLLRPGEITVELTYGFHLDGIPGRDDRPLALAIKRLGLLSHGREWPPPPRGRRVVVKADEETLLLRGSGSYVVPLRLPATAAALDFDLGVTAGSGEAALAIGLISWDGREETLLTLTPQRSGGSHHRLALAGHRGRQVFLVFDAAVTGGGRFAIRRPRLVAGSGPVATPPRPRPAPAQLPHVVLIILDAARADHFGVYGYDRDTTPHIDRFAAEALVFTQATAECSYTICSMPNLLTGLSFVQHGLVAKRLRLDPRVTTLAETLAGIGYQTIGFTGNPNNSRRTGTAQGFAEFTEIWETHPGAITREVSRRLGAGIGDRPLFLQLHYVPPHEPYAPDPEFDLFGDPAYRGPVTSDREFARAVYSRQVSLGEADLEELVALYDGNLRMVGDAVGRVFAALREAGLWDRSLVVVTADHGEAFLEHGRVGHNTTVYEEMIRVPLIVKLPEGRSGEGVATDRLVALGDFVPTILALVGLAPGAEIGGQDLLAPPGASDPDRLIVLRSSQPEATFFGVRTARWKAIARPGGGAELYDLEADPGETVNLATARPLLHAGLILLLEAARRAPAPLRAGTDEEGPTEEEEKMLRALGYL